MSHEKDIFIPRRAGTYNYCASTGSATPIQLTNSTLYVGTFLLPKARTLTRIGVEVTTASSAGGTLRLGIWGDDGDGFPSVLLLDSGVSGSNSTILNNGLIDTTSATVQEITISLALPAGLYWVGGVVQGTPATAPFVRCINSVTGTIGSAVIPTANNAPLGYTQSSVTSTLPNPFAGGTTALGTVPRIFVKT